MSDTVARLLSDRDEIERRLASARFMLQNINSSLEEDARIAEAHQSAKIEICCTIAVCESQLTEIDEQLSATVQEVESEKSF